MPFAHPALRVVEIAAGAFDLAARALLGRVIDDKRPLIERADLILLKDPPSQFAGEPTPN